MRRFAHLFLITFLGVLAGCAKKEVDAYVVNVIGRDTAEMVARLGRPDQRQSRTGEMESLTWKEGDFSVQSTVKEGKVMRLVFLSKDSALMESVLSMVKERFSEGHSWHPERKKVFSDIVEVVVRGDSKITVYRDKEAIYVFGTEIWQQEDGEPDASANGTSLTLSPNMKSGDYASEILGVRLMQRQELPPVATQWSYCVTPEFTADSARSVFTELPDACEVCFFDPETPKEEVYLFIRRVGKGLVRRRGGHGWMSGAETEEVDRAASWLMASHFVKQPHPEFEAFSVSQNR